MVLVDQTFLESLVVSFLGRVVLDTLLMDLFYEVSWVLFDAVNSILEEKELLDVLGLLLALMEQLNCCGQAFFTFLNTDFFIDRK